MASIVTNIAMADATRVIVRGRDLINDLIGKYSFTEMFYFLICERFPTQAETRVLDACLITLMEHGFTPAAVISRIMAESVPDQIQVSIASGLLTIGNVHAGTMEGCAALLTEGVKAEDQDTWCRETLARFRERKKAVPGFGHKMHKPVDPRTKPLLDVARANQLDGPYVQLLLKMSAMIDEAAGKHVTINATGALAALLLEIGIAPSIVRAIAVVSRCAGLVGHILEEKKTTSSRVIINKARETIPYADPAE